MKESQSAGSSSSGNNNSNNNGKTESHRIYWQQWPSTGSPGGGPPAVASRRDLITSSAAIRISPNGAKAQDVTNLLCETLNLKINDNSHTSPPQESWDKVQDAWEQDSLVLVGTLYSLPQHYVRFEHEGIDSQPQRSTSSSLAGDASSHSSSSAGKIQISKTDPPFHVIKTLSPTDNPPQIRDKMMKHLQNLLEEGQAAAFAASSARITNSISPKLQWYFVPGKDHPASPIPSYIDLDGYSTSMEEEHDEDEGSTSSAEESSSADHVLDYDASEGSDQEVDPDFILNPTMSLQEKNSIEIETKSKDNLDEVSSKKKNCSYHPEEQILRKERQRFMELSMSQSNVLSDCLSGYLLKQSMTDPYVWKRVHCVLTDHHLWFISRVHTKSKCSAVDAKFDDVSNGKNSDEEEITHDQKDQQPQKREFYSFAKHRRLRLTRALLIQPSSERPTAPLYRTPFAFEVIASDGIPHRFRATSPALHKKWTEALSSRIVQSYENSLFDHAELIVRDETEARNKRFMSLVVEPLWENQKNNLQNDTNNHRHVVIDSPTMNILRFGIEVSEYRERCRHIQAILPPKHPVLALTDPTVIEEQTNGDDHNRGSVEGTNPHPHNSDMKLDLQTQAMIKSAWDEAVRLGSSATKLAMGLQEEKGEKAKMPRSLETICQHLEYVITGDFRRPLSDPSGVKQPIKSKQHASKNDNTRQFPPPVDLFDALLAELQAVSTAVTKKKRISSLSSRTSMDGSAGTVSGKSSSTMNGVH